MSDSYSVCLRCNKLNRVDLERAQQKQPVCGSCAAELPFHKGLNELNAATLAKLIQKSPRPVVVDFWAPWCGPCRAFAPSFEKAAQELGSQVVFAKLNTELEPAGGAAHQVRSIPTLIYFAGGREVDRQMGAMPLPMFLQWLRSQAGGSSAHAAQA